MKDVACSIYYTDERYDRLFACSRDSFLKFNGNECDLFEINKDNKSVYDDMLTHYDSGTETFLMQYIYAYEIMMKYGYKKMIIMGADTITCSRLDEFLDDNSADVLGTLNYPCQESTEYWKSPIVNITLPDGRVVQDHMNINADVVCFNNPESLKKVIDLSIEHFGYFSIQGGLNELAWTDKSYSVKIVDAPYPLSKVVYNARSKGVFGTNMCNQNTPQYRWIVRDNKLFTEDGKQIKVWHYIEGLGGRPDEGFMEVLNGWIFKLFNADTKKFFKEQCDCKDFFEKPYFW